MSDDPVIALRMVLFNPNHIWTARAGTPEVLRLGNLVDHGFLECTTSTGGAGGWYMFRLTPRGLDAALGQPGSTGVVPPPHVRPSQQAGKRDAGATAVAGLVIMGACLCWGAVIAGKMAALVPAIFGTLVGFALVNMRTRP